MSSKIVLGLAGLFLLAGSASAQIKGGKAPWNHDPQAGMAEAKKNGLPMMLYFTSKG